MKREIRSFVLRQGRMTHSQTHALATQSGKFCLHTDRAVDPQTTFNRTAPLTLEIGFGMGQSLVEMAKATPDADYIGVEVHAPGVGALLNSMATEAITNIRVWHDDVVKLLKEYGEDLQCDTVQIFFPDPWPKKKHHKRRLIQATFIKLLCQHIKLGGKLHVATDWVPYAEHILETLEAEPLLKNTAEDGGHVPRPDFRPMTKFERRGLNKGHEVRDFIFERVAL